MRRRSMVIAAAIVLALAGQPAKGDQDDPRLDKLFDRLQSAETRPEARRVEQRIWSIWRWTDDEGANLAMRLGIRAMNRGDLESAIAQFDEAVRLAPDFAEGFNKRATAYFLLEEYKLSIADIKRTLDLEPRHFGALSGLAQIYMRLGEEAPALKALEKAVEIYPKMPGAERHLEALREAVEGEPT